MFIPVDEDDITQGSLFLYFQLSPVENLASIARQALEPIAPSKSFSICGASEAVFYNRLPEFTIFLLDKHRHFEHKHRANLVALMREKGMNHYLFVPEGL